MTVVRLDLIDLANEWQELRDELDDDAHDLPLTAQEADDLRAECEKYEELCRELGISPIEPATLRWYSDNQADEYIHEDSFEEFAREFAEEVCALPEGWPCSCIDWSKAADELRMDYTTITYDGEDYLTR